MPRSPGSLGAGLAMLLACAALGVPAAAQPSAPASALSVTDAWVRAIPGADVAAAYMRLTNGGTRPVRVDGVRSALAGHAMIHETRLENGVSTMRPHEPLVIAPGASVELKPGGLHLMLHELAHPLTVGEEVPLELLLEGGGSIAVSARVRPLSAE
ncbi:MAG TPA: copper chaperone PCu(A)C [Steroidobacteraceae bacterium]|nr:copper chaperone PCu(A)C [Steroidobacteraceae bacterium]